MKQQLKSSLQDINEIIVAVSTITVSVPSSTVETVESFAHGLDRAPYFTYMISFDNKKWIAPTNGNLGNENLYNLYMYTDKTNVYFHYLHATGTSLPSAFNIYVNYKLYITEVS